MSNRNRKVKTQTVPVKLMLEAKDNARLNGLAAAAARQQWEQAQQLVLQVQTFLAAILYQQGETTITMDTIEVLQGRAFSLIRSIDDDGNIVLDVDLQDAPEVSGEAPDH